MTVEVRNNVAIYYEGEKGYSAENARTDRHGQDRRELTLTHSDAALRAITEATEGIRKADAPDCLHLSHDYALTLEDGREYSVYITVMPKQ